MKTLVIDGKEVRVDDATALRMKNLSVKEKLKEILDKFWTDKKLGKHKSLKNDHGEILLKTLLVDPETFDSDLNGNKLKVGDMSSSIKSLISGTKLDGDLREEYLRLCLNVTTERPAIGKGEFLFAATFANLGFSSESGDLVDLESGSKIEVKGISAQLGNGQNSRFRQLTESIVYTLLKKLDIVDVAKSDMYLNEEVAKKIKTAIGLDRNKAAFAFSCFQNIRNENESISRSAANLYFETKQFIRTVAAMHLFTYMKLEKSDYLLILNDAKFTIFRAPGDLLDAYRIVEKLSIKPWRVGEYGIKVTLRNDV